MQPKTGQLLLGKLARVNGNSEAVFCSLSSLLSLCAGIGSVGVRARAQREGAVEVASSLLVLLPWTLNLSQPILLSMKESFLDP